MFIFFFPGIEMSFAGKEKKFCVLTYSRTQSNKTTNFICEGICKYAPTSKQI